MQVMQKKSIEKKSLKIFDVNLNRSREGLRVIEDTLRLVLNNRAKFKAVRNLRHELDRLTRKAYLLLLENRDVARDPGRKIKEKKRGGINSLVAANFRRVQESLRVLEEYSKIFDFSDPSKFKKIRFKAYEIEKKVTLNDNN